MHYMTRQVIISTPRGGDSLDLARVGRQIYYLGSTYLGTKFTEVRVQVLTAVEISIYILRHYQKL
jgi:hypothetical protein